MLTHLIILLDDTSVSYCHYEVVGKKQRLIDVDVLKRGIVWAMKENLNIQFVYSDHELPAAYEEAVESIDHTKIKPFGQAEGADVVVLSDWEQCMAESIANQTCILRASREELYAHQDEVKTLLGRVQRLNIVLTDVETFTDTNIDAYRTWLESMADFLVDQYRSRHNVQLNLLTDRLILSEMNNCNAGDTNVTLAPNGKFYLCPAFYYDDERQSIGDLEQGLCIKNRQLLRLNHAPICRNCDAYQCRRCIWMNGRLTMDCNTPSHQQCVVAHLERNASGYLIEKLNAAGIRLENSHEVEEMKELDPFNIVNKWK